ncbi:MAG: hypothetical protein HFE45_10290 [Oscillospiraceae bacterium]|nr:hypothetical protein [Oscillospiraceae bacterium]
MLVYISLNYSIVIIITHLDIKGTTIFSGNIRYAREDAAIIAENMLLTAHLLGLGACYIGHTDEVFATE